jgi:hypothetical protein
MGGGMVAPRALATSRACALVAASRSVVSMHALASLLGSNAIVPDVLRQPDWVVVGLVLAIAGTFLLANAILFRDPREMLRDAFGLERQRLGTIRTYIFHRVQVTLGFLLMLSGFALQLFGRSSQEFDTTREFPILWVGLTVAAVALAQLLGWWISRGLFQRYVRQMLIEGDVELESDSKLTREVGELFDVEMLNEDTVQSYAARVRARVRLPRPSSTAVPHRDVRDAREPRISRATRLAGSGVGARGPSAREVDEDELGADELTIEEEAV